MFTGVYRIVSGMMQEVDRQELIAENLAGSNLAGFKGRHLVGSRFAQYLADAVEAAPQEGGDVERPPIVMTDHQQGGLKRTDRSLDFALVGDGFFEVMTDDDQALLTRNGNFLLNAKGVLVTQEGHRVQGSGGEIRFAITDSATSAHVSEDGALAVIDPQGNERQLGRLKVVQVSQPAKLNRLTANYYAVPADAETSAARDAQVVNGYQESANVSPIQEMAAMIESVRDFERGQKMLQMLADMTRQEQQKLQA